MPINNITQTISELPAAGRRGVDVQTVFVNKQEDFQDHLQGTTVTELNTLKDQLNTRIGEINSTTTTMNGYATSASSSATTATTKAGEASTSATAALTSKNQASTFATNSSNSATKASQWADNNYDVEVEAGKYSAKHWATVAQSSAVEDTKGANIASASTITVGTAGLGDYIHITGTTTITSLGAATSAGTRRTLIFDGALTLTHNATSLICPNSVSIVTIAGTAIEVIAETTTDWRVVSITHPSVSFTELGYLNGVTSAIQTQLNTKFTTTSATTSTAGIVELATDAETITGTDTTRAITPANLRSAFNKTGTAPMFACRAWVNFNGTGTVAMRASGNVSSITDNEVGDYTVNFTTNMPDVNYVVTETHSANNGTQHAAGLTLLSTGSVRLKFSLDGSSSYPATDPDTATVGIIR